MACSSTIVDKIEMETLKRGAEEGDAAKFIVKYYQASELIPSPRPPLHQLLKREPAAWAFVQISSGVLNVALGVAFAVVLNDDFGKLLLTLMRVPIVTGLLFLVAGFLCTLLHTRPGLLQVCLHFNVGCAVAAVVGSVLLCVDLGKKNIMGLEEKVEILILCVMLLDMLISGVLILLIKWETRRQEKK